MFSGAILRAVTPYSQFTVHSLRALAQICFLPLLQNCQGDSEFARHNQSHGA